MIIRQSAMVLITHNSMNALWGSDQVVMAVVQAGGGELRLS